VATLSAETELDAGVPEAIGLASVNSREPSAFWAALGEPFVAVGDFAFFALRAWSGLFSRRFSRGELLRVSSEIGVDSVLVVAITGLFIGMVLAVQTYAQFHSLGLDTSLGGVIHMSIVRELGPVLAAMMLAGRIGTAMAAQLGTMKVTEQIEALACLGVDPVKYLVAPRFLASLLLLPLLTILADALGVVGSSLICLKVFRIDGFHYWKHTTDYVSLWDLFTGLGKSIIFGAALSLLCCWRGFRSRAGAAGVGRAATEGFVLSFTAILVLDFFLGMAIRALGTMVWQSGNKLI